MKWLLLLALLPVFQEPDVDALLKQLADDSIVARDKAAAALVELGEKAEEKVKARLETADGELKQLCKRILEQIAIPKKLRGILPPLRKVTIEAKDRNVKDVFEDLKQQCGLAVTIQNAVGGDITVSAKDVTPLEALDAVCKAANLGYTFDRYPTSKTIAAGGPPMVSGDLLESRIRVQPGYVTVARQFTRHYVIEPFQISMSKSSIFNRSNTNASLLLRVAWPQDVKPQSGEVAVASVVDDKGRSLMQPGAPAMIGRHSSGSFPTSMGTLQSSIQLTYPESDAEKLTVKGTVNLKYLMEEKLLTFDEVEPAEPVKKERDGITVELLELKTEEGQIRVKFTISGGAATPGDPMGMSNRNPVRARLEDGSLAQQVSSGYSGGGLGAARRDFTFMAKGKFKALEVVVDSVYHSDSFDFELKDIPLPK
jgi:hypothetical protein